MCRVSSRGGYGQDARVSYIGFRVVLPVHSQFKIAGNGNHNFCFQGEPVKSFNGIAWTHQIENKGAGISMVAKDMAFCSDSKGYLYAIDCKTGDLIWKFNAGSKLYDGPNIKDNTAYLGTANGTIFSINLSTGKENWRIKTNGNVCFPPNLKDKLGYALSHDKKLYIFDLESGEIQDTVKENHVLCGTPKIEHDNIYYTDWGGNFHCVDLISKEKKWTFNTKEDTKRFTNPSISDSPAYFVYDSTLFAVNSKSGDLQWTFKSDGGLIRTPAVKDNLIVFTTAESHLYVLDITKRETVWDFRSEGINWSRPIIVEDVVYYASGNNVIHAFDLMTGNKYWEYKFVNETNVPINGNSAPYYYNKALYIACGKTVYKIE
jgi:outer membrane protein assembly factor BamB